MALPDLIVQSITHTPRYPTTNYTVTFTVTVKNQGDEQAGASVLYVTITGPKDTDYTINVPALDPGDTYVAQFTQKLVPKGTYTVTAYADNTNVVVESDETNNTKTINVTCSTPNKEDLVVEVLEYTPANPTEADTITITSRVRNIGPNQTVPSTLQIDVGGETNPPTYSIPALDSDALYTVQRQITLAPGTYQITATADIYNTVHEYDENNNTTIESVTVAAIPKPDLIVSSLSHDPANPTIFDTITITAVVENTGEVASTTSTLEIDACGEPTPATYEIPPLDPQETYQIERQFNPTVFGFCQVTATADADDDNWESDENNNTSTDNISVIAPDLVVSTLSHDPIDPTNIDTITISAVVQNIGDAIATTSTLEIDVDGDALSYEIPILAPSETFEVERGIILSLPGAHLVTATADADADVVESNESNNITTDTINVIEAPDLIITTLTHDPTNPTITDTITITTIVKNRGETTANPSTLEIDISGEATPPTYAVPSLAPEETFQVERQVNLTTPGTYQVTATADVNEEVAESNEDNNTATDTIQVKAPDLIVQSLTHSPASPSNIENITITAIVKNNGDANAGASTLEIKVGTEATPPTYAIPALAPGVTHQIQRQLTLGTPNTYTVTAKADVNSAVTESNETNNTASDSITVVKAADLIINSLTHSPTNPTITDTITITAIVQNTGARSAGASTLEIEIQGETTPATYPIPSLAAGATYQVQRQVNLTTPGNYQVTATADVNNVVTESDETNNTATDSFEVKAPDLIISSLTHSPPSPTNIETITITAIVKNNGNSNAGASTLEIKVGTEATPPTYVIPALAPNATHQIQRQLTLGTPNTYTVTAKADVNTAVTESNETNNTASDSITVVKAADLVISSLTHSPANPTITDTITITAVVQNTGAKPAGASTLKIEIQGETTPATYPISSLAAGATQQIQRQVNLTTPGNYNVTATADLNNVVAEADETNNTATDSFEVKAPDLIISSLTHSPASPSNIENITITAIVKNNGNSNAGASTLEIKVGTETTPPTYAIPALAPNATHQIQRQLTLATPDTYTITATADKNTAVAESNETNNTASDSITVVKAPDLIIQSLTHAPTNPTITDTITITAIVQNTGARPAGASTLEIKLDSDATPPTYSIPALAAGATHQIERQVNLTTPGNYQATATADLNDDVAESDETNNTATDSFQVTAPDLVVESLTHEPSNPTNIDTITIKAVVKNTGDTTASLSTLEIEIEGEITPATYPIPALLPDETFEVEREVTLSTPDTYQVTATADVDDDVAESDETNNTATDTIDVIEAPDLIVSKLAYEGFADDIAVTSETTTLKIEVKNQSSTACTSSTLAILVGDAKDPVLFDIPALDGGTTYSIEMEIVFSEPGSVLITATADAEDAIEELDEENNVATIMIEVYVWDFETLKNYLLGKSEFSDFQKRLYDINKDGKVDMGDLVRLILHLRNIV
jgi:subtilase family serine protease